MRRRHRDTEPVETFAEYLSDHYASQLTAEHLATALEKLDLKIVATDGPASAGAPTGDGTETGLVCMDGPEGCDGDLATLLDTRHIRCERHWSLFLESEGM